MEILSGKTSAAAVDDDEYIYNIYVCVCSDLLIRNNLTNIRLSIRNVPTVTISPCSDTVWKDGASADISHLYRPLLDRARSFRKTCVAFDLSTCGHAEHM